VRKILVILLLASGALQAQTITTIAGNGTIGRTGDGGDAKQAQVFFPYGVTTDKGGNLYIADNYNYCIRKVSSKGVISTIAGSAQTGYGGDNEQALMAVFAEITDVATDAAGNLYITDYGNRRIRKMSVAGIVTTVAGNGGDYYNGDGGKAVNAGLGNGPIGICVDGGGNLLFSDNGNLRKISAAGQIARIAGNGSFAYSGDGGPATAAGMVKPKGVAIDTAGNIYVADYDDNRVRKINKAGIISTFAGNGYTSEPGFGAFYGDNGPATDAELSGPTGLAVDGAGNVFIGDYNNHCVRRVDIAGVITTVAGTGVNGYSGDGGPANKATFLSTAGLTIDAGGNLYICDPVNNRVRKVSNAAVPPVVSTQKK
jgi:sugar lactone lactonase YvrE